MVACNENHRASSAGGFFVGAARQSRTDGRNAARQPRADGRGAARRCAAGLIDAALRGTA